MHVRPAGKRVSDCWNIEMDPNNLPMMFMLFAFTLLLIIFFALVAWARTRSTGATAAGAAMIGLGMVPDPILEEQLKVIHEAREEAPEEDETGAGRE